MVRMGKLLKIVHFQFEPLLIEVIESICKQVFEMYCFLFQIPNFLENTLYLGMGMLLG